MINPNDYNILVVEDSAIQAEVLRRALAAEGYQVSVVENGAKALDIIRTTPPSLIISDVMMPVMDGYKMCQEVKTDTKLKHIPVILLTDLSNPKDVIRGLNAKADNYVTKPCNTNLLLSRIEDLLTRHREFDDNGLKEALELNYGGESFFVSSGPRQILNLLISTYENAVQQRQELIEAQSNLVTINDELDNKLRALQESELRFSVLVQTIPDIVYRIDDQGRFIFVNNAVRRLGYEPEELVGRHFSEIIWPPDVQAVSSEYVLPNYLGKITGREGAPKLFDERRTGDRITQNLEVRLVPKGHKYGKPAMVESIGTELLVVEVNSSGLYEVVLKPKDRLLASSDVFGPEKSVSPKCLGTVGVIRDVTDRKLAEAALERSEVQFRQLVQTAGSAIILLSSDFRVLEWNQEAERVFGQTRDEILRRHFLSLLTVEEEREKMVSSLKDVLQYKSVKDFEMSMMNHLGQERKLLWNMSMLVDIHRRPEGVILVGQDVTDWKKAEEDRLSAKAEAEMARISAKVATETIDGMLDAVMLINPDGSIVQLNKGLTNSMGWGREVIGTLFTRYFIEENNSAVRTEFEKCLSDVSSGKNIECTAITKDNRYIPILLNMTVLKDADGQPLTIIAALRDVTELRQVMDALAERAVALERANADLDQFARISSHHLQEPIRKVTNFSELLVSRYRGQFDEAGERYLSYIIDGAARMQSLIEALLLYTGLERDGPRNETVDLNEIISTIISGLDAKIKSTLSVVTSEDLPCLRADSMEMTLLFKELISNAIKFRSEEPLNVYIAANSDSGSWIFSVHDNGIGIDPLYSEKMFDLFQTLHSLGKYHGTGMGLALCKKIVERHGGRIWVESKPGDGSTFYFTLWENLTI